ncbi:MAG: ComEA family DNA-binding protein [bacterium]|nr:ComEA family DNA-binding protein [bacterium]
MKYLKKYKYLVLIIGFIIIIGISLLTVPKKKVEHTSTNVVKEEFSSLLEEKQIETTILGIEVKGEVINPGVYSLEDNKRVIDAINMAGGLTDNADTSLINLSKKLIDEMVIIVYSKEQVKNSNIKETVIQVVEKECVCPNIANDACLNTKIDDTISNKENSGSGEDTAVSLNTATSEQLQTVPGIGQAKAEAIIAYREKNGGFKSIEELLEVDGIAQSTYEKIKIYFTL